MHVALLQLIGHKKPTRLVPTHVYRYLTVHVALFQLTDHKKPRRLVPTPVYRYLSVHVALFQLIGHKKPSVPIFATGLSLLEPIRGGVRERGLGVGGQSAKGISPSTTTHAPTLVDPSQRDAEPHTQVGRALHVQSKVWSLVDTDVASALFKLNC